MNVESLRIFCSLPTNNKTVCESFVSVRKVVRLYSPWGDEKFPIMIYVFLESIYMRCSAAQLPPKEQNQIYLFNMWNILVSLSADFVTVVWQMVSKNRYFTLTYSKLIFIAGGVYRCALIYLKVCIVCSWINVIIILNFTKCYVAV